MTNLFRSTSSTIQKIQELLLSAILSWKTELELFITITLYHFGTSAMILSSNKIIKSKNEFPYTQIYYVSHIGTWLTIDQESGIHLWDLEKELSDELPTRHTGIILDMQEIIYLKIVVFSTLKQQLVFWNLAMRLLIKIINMDTVSIHSMCFVPDYKLLATANFGKNIHLWRFVDQDITKCTELIGHTSQVTCVNYLLDSPLIITSDDTGLIKAWDLRNSQ